MNPHWIEKEAVLTIHLKLLRRFGGADGIRDESLLESAMARPEQLFHYEKANVYALAAAYCFGIVKNHPFIDGNKRTGFMTAYAFLGINGHRLIASEEDALRQTISLAASAISEEDYATWLSKSCEEI